jgi:hypothetical protein
MRCLNLAVVSLFAAITANTASVAAESSHYVLLLLSWPVIAPPVPPGGFEQRPVQAFGSTEFNSEAACKNAISALQANERMRMMFVKYEALCVPKG